MTLQLPLRRNVQETNFLGKVSGRAALRLLKTGIPTFKSCLERLNHSDNINFQNLRKKNGEEEVRFHFSITEKPQRQRLSIIMPAQECPGDPSLCNQSPQISVAQSTTIILLLSLTSLGVGWAQPSNSHSGSVMQLQTGTGWGQSHLESLLTDMAGSRC